MSAFKNQEVLREENAIFRRLQKGGIVPTKELAELIHYTKGTVVKRIRGLRYRGIEVEFVQGWRLKE